MTTQTTTLRDIICAADLTTIDDSGAYTAKLRAQVAMRGRTHYYDDAVLRYFECRIQSSQVHADGVLHSTVSSMPATGPGRAREFRYTIHDFTGQHIAGSELGDGYRTSDAASKARHAAVAALDPAEVVRAALMRTRADALRQVSKTADALAALDSL